MKKNLEILLIFIFISLILFFAFDIVSSNKKVIFIRKEIENTFKDIFNLGESDAILVLGKMGGWHYGAENTDAIFVIYLKDNSLFVIHIPRDLIVKINGDFYKINSLWELKKKEELLKEVSIFTGLNIKKYIIFDSYLIKEVIDKMGGLRVTLLYPVTDAVTGYTLKPGTYILNGEMVEFVARSRYYPDGDFTRMKNQFIIVKSLKEQLSKESVEKLLSLANFIIGLKKHYETNLSYGEILDLIKKISKIPPERFKEINIGYDKNIWLDGNFEVRINSHKVIAYGLIPKNGTGEYSTIRKFIREKIKEAIAEKY